MLNLAVKFDVRELNVYLSRFDDRGFRTAFARSLNRVATTARKLVANQIAREMSGKLSTAKVKSAMPHMRKARSTEPVNAQEEHIGGEVAGLSLSLFSPVQKPKGVVFKVGGRTRLSPHSFIARGRGAKKKTVFRLLRHRVAQQYKKRSHGEPELPIEKATYKSVYKQEQDRKSVQLIEQVVSNRFTKELQENINFLLFGTRG